MKWEHFALKIDADDLGTSRRLTGLEMQLDDVGTHGWELVSVDSGIAYFKRAIEPDTGMSEEVFNAKVAESIRRMMK